MSPESPLSVPKCLVVSCPLNISKDSEVASVCTTATGSEGSDISMHLQMHSCRSPWEAAVLRANLVAISYKVGTGNLTEPKKKQKKVVLSAEEKYLAGLSEEYSVRFAYNLKAEPSCGFEKFRSEFFYKNASHFCRQLQPLYNPTSARWNLRPAPISQHVQKKFLETLAAKGREKLMLAFHGTNENALRSIYSSGLLVPGKESGVKVANGSAFGVGIYAGKADNAAISWSYARGESRPLLVCAALDGTAEEVHNHANFHVFKTDHSVVPLFEATLPDSQNRLPPATLVTMARYVVRKRTIVPDAKKPKGPGPKTRIPNPLASPAVVVFLSRRAAGKRRGTSRCGWKLSQNCTVCRYRAARFIFASQTCCMSQTRVADVQCTAFATNDPMDQPKGCMQKAGC